MTLLLQNLTIIKPFEMEKCLPSILKLTVFNTHFNQSISETWYLRLMPMSKSAGVEYFTLHTMVKLLFQNPTSTDLLIIVTYV